MSTEGSIIFTGSSAEEAEDFVFAIKKHAYENGKQKDDEWIASYASICFAKGALRWYEELDDETQNDWKLLRRAILREYKEAPGSTSPSIPTSASAFTPAAAPASLTRGRIRVDSPVPGLRGYISTTFVDSYGWCCIAQADTAAWFEYDSAQGEITFLGNKDAYLVIRAHRADWSLVGGSADCGALMKNEGRTIAVKKDWSNVVKFDSWSTVGSTQLIGNWPSDAGGLVKLQWSAATKDNRIYAVSDQQGFSKKYGEDAYKPITLYFET